MSRNIFLVIAVLLSSGVYAAEWSVGSGIGVRNALVPIEARFTGDGQTQGAQLDIVFDDARLSLPVDSGNIPGASRNGGICSKVSANRVVVLLPLNSQAATASTVYCEIPFTVRNNAAAGSARLSGTRALCFNAAAQPVTQCGVQNGAITVNAPVAGGPITFVNPYQYLYVLLSGAQDAPTVSSLTNYGFSSGNPLPVPLVGLRVESPRKVVAALPRRAAGDFATYLRTNPNLTRAKLERYVIVQYNRSANLATAKAALLADPFVLYVHEPLLGQFSTPPSATSAPLPHIPAAARTDAAIQDQYHLEGMRVPQAWAWAGGWGLVAIADTGLETNHPELKSFTGPGSVGGTRINGGNFLPALSEDISQIIDGGVQVSPNVDEMRPMVGIIDGANPAACDALDGITDGLLTPQFPGHGTHVSGLVAANSLDGNGTSGMCKNCGLALRKIALPYCVLDVSQLRVFLFLTELPFTNSFGAVLDVGPQVVNTSFGGPDFYCSVQTENFACLSLELSKEMDVIVSAASGNDRTSLQFPASDPRTKGIGGIDASFLFWDESPGSTTACPPAYGGRECGSNYTQNAAEKRQEIVTPAKNVRSTFYTGKTWNAALSCGDDFGSGSPADGSGLCTGTSMSAPIASGLYGLLRSINPLVKQAAELPTSPIGVIEVVERTTDRAQLGIPWDFRYGYGLPDAEAAAKMMLGTVKQDTVRNRATPLFQLYSPGAMDYATTTVPQIAITYLRFSTARYYSTPESFVNFIAGNLIPGYSQFPPAAGPIPPEPRALAYVLTTEFPPNTVPSAQLTPLYWLDRKRPWPLGCLPAQCNAFNRDSLLLTGTARLNAAVAAGYEYKGLQGYVYATQAPNTVALRLQCKAADDDCAVFTEAERSAFIAAGYSQGFLGASNSIIGYVYGPGDMDADGLADAQEYVIGTSATTPDSDADGTIDSVEFPQAGISISDPCSNAAVLCTAPTANIFKNGFE